MNETILERLAKRAPRSNDAEEYLLEKKTRKLLSNIKFLQRRSKNKYETRGGLYSMGAKGVYVKNGDVYSRRVVVKAIIKKNNGKNFQENLRKHLEYITRNGAGKDGEKPELFSGDEESLILKNIEKNFSEAPHNFRFIISPEDGEQIDLNEFTNSLIKTIEKDLGTKIEWIASVHYDTNEPHIHLLINGHDKLKEQLLITRDYISNGIRNRASQIISNKLGLREWDEVVKSLNLEVNKNKKIGLDDIIASHLNNGQLDLKKLTEEDLDDMPKGLLQKRFLYLESQGLAKQGEKGVWRIEENYLESLRQIDRSSALIDKIGLNLAVDKDSFEVLTANKLSEKPMRGQVIKRGYVDELSEAQYLVVKTAEAKHFYIALEKYSEKSPARVGEIVRIDATKPFSGPKVSDHTIDKEAKENGEIYDAHQHAKRAEINISLPYGVNAKEYVQVHINRLEVLARRGLVVKLADGCFSIPKGYLENLSLEAKKSREGFTPHIKVTRLSAAKVQKPKLSQGLKPC
jgi:type IV secretory pathway VirD2 relaxase